MRMKWQAEKNYSWEKISTCTEIAELWKMLPLHVIFKVEGMVVKNTPMIGGSDVFVWIICTLAAIKALILRCVVTCVSLGLRVSLPPFSITAHIFCSFLSVAHVNLFTMCRVKSDQNTRYIDANTKMPLWSISWKSVEKLQKRHGLGRDVVMGQSTE